MSHYVDPTGFVLDCNNASEQQFGRRSAGMVGKVRSSFILRNFISHKIYYKQMSYLSASRTNEKASP
jgi:hypothetical protein